MQGRDYRDIIGGGLLLLLGLATLVYALAHYAVGTIGRMGPGMFPAALGGLLALFGLAIGVPALLRSGSFPVIDAAPLVSILSGAAAFALLVERIGYVPAVFAATLISTLAVRRLGLVHALAFCLGLAALAYVLFGLGLNLPIPAFSWRF
jgi:hypothetical protein